MQDRRTLNPQSVRSRGFTLLELLAVIATIGTLAALLLPVLAKTKSRALQAGCVSNIRQLGYAWQMYSNENEGRLVETYPANNPNAWVNGDLTRAAEATDTRLLETGKLYPHVRNHSVYRCPSDRGKEIADKRVQSVRSYSMNCFMGAGEETARLLPFTASKYVRFTKESDLSLQRASELFVFVDEDDRSIDDGCFVTHPDGRVWIDFPSISSYRHRFSYTLLFADMHAENWRISDPRTKDVKRNGTEQFANEDLGRLSRAATVLIK